MGQISKSEGITTQPAEQQIAEIRDLIALESVDTDEIIENGKKLYQLIETLSVGGADEELMRALTPEQVFRAQTLSLKFEITLDNRFMDNVIAGKIHSPDDHPLQVMYNHLGFMEGTGIRRCLGRDFSRPLIHIGSGYAETAIAIYRQFGVPVICIEKDRQTAQKAEKTLACFSLLGKEKIRILSFKGEEILPEGDAVIISAMVPNTDKKIMVSNLRNLAYGEPSDPLLVLRTPSKPVYSLEYPVLFDDTQIFQYSLREICNGDTQPYLTPQDPIRSRIYKAIESATVRMGFDVRPIMTAAKLKPITS
jgi:hypothetical protein